MLLVQCVVYFEGYAGGRRKAPKGASDGSPRRQPGESDRIQESQPA